MADIMDVAYLEIENRIAYLKLNRPNVMNAMDDKMLIKIRDLLQEVKATDTDVLIIAGNGKGFSSGGDINVMLSEIEKADFDRVMDTIKELIVTLYTLPKIVISAVHGAAAGLGFSLALATDYIIAEDSAKFAMSFIKIGLIPDGGSHFFLAKRLGDAKAMQFIWEGKNQSAEEVLALGLINEITAKTAVEAAKERAEAILQLPIQAMLQTKLILNESNVAELNRFLDLEKTTQYKMRNTIDHKEGIKAFSEKRMPKFIGR